MDTTNDDPMTAAMLNATTSTTNTLSMAAEGLSDAQEKVLAILPIPSAILSIFGSATILYMCCRTRNERKWTTYTRLLIGLSICDILSSLTLGVAAFLRPRDNLRVWTFGNEATCSAIGFLTQFSYSGLFYNAMLSFYFLLSARFRIKNERIAKRIEPFMHFLSLLFPLVTASVGAEMGVYSTTTSELGCWVNDYPRGCIGDECVSVTIGWYYFGMPFLMSLISIVTSNVVILVYVWKQTRPIVARQQQESKRGSTVPIDSDEMPVDDISEHEQDDGYFRVVRPAYHEPDSAILNSPPGRSSRILRNTSMTSRGVSESTFSDHHQGAGGVGSGSSRLLSVSSLRQSFQRRRENNTTNSSNHDDDDINSAEKDQVRRLWLVTIQALLFVASYLFTAGWLGLLRIIESMADTPQDELEMASKIYPLMVSNAFMAPLQGLFNMMVFLRPKYKKWRHEYPNESKRWAIRRAIFGKSVRPTQKKKEKKTQQQQQKPPETTHDGVVVQHEQQKDELPRDSSNSYAEENLNDYDDDHHHQEHHASHPATTRLPKSMVSSLTVSMDDVIPEDEEDEGWDGSKKIITELLSPNNQGHNKERMSHSLHSSASSFLNSSTSSVLEVISELSESVFEPMQICRDDAEDYDSKATPNLSQRTPPFMLSPEASESRWCSSSRSSRSPRIVSMAGAVELPQRYASEDTTNDTEILHDDNNRDDDDVVAPVGHSSSRPNLHHPASHLSLSSRSAHSFEDENATANADTPVRAPLRRLSPPPEAPELPTL